MLTVSGISVITVSGISVITVHRNHYDNSVLEEACCQYAGICMKPVYWKGFERRSETVMDTGKADRG